MAYTVFRFDGHSGAPASGGHSQIKTGRHAGYVEALPPRQASVSSAAPVRFPRVLPYVTLTQSHGRTRSSETRCLKNALCRRATVGHMPTTHDMISSHHRHHPKTLFPHDECPPKPQGAATANSKPQTREGHNGDWARRRSCKKKSTHKTCRASTAWARYKAAAVNKEWWIGDDGPGQKRIPNRPDGLGP